MRGRDSGRPPGTAGNARSPLVRRRIGSPGSAALSPAARGAFAAVVLGLLALAGWGRSARRGFALAGAALLIGGAGLTLGTVLAQRLAAPGSAEVPGRAAMWQVAVDLWREQPLLGAGPGAFRRLAPERLDVSRYRPAHAHSTPLHLLAETGLIGLAAFATVWVRFFAALRQRAASGATPPGPAPPYAAASGIAIVAFLAMGFFEHNFGDAEVVILAFFLAGLPFGARDSERERA